VSQFGFEVVNLADTCICLNQFCQITDVSDEPECNSFRGPDSVNFTLK